MKNVRLAAALGTWIAPLAWAHPGHDHPVEYESGIAHYLLDHRYAVIGVAASLILVGSLLLRRTLRRQRRAASSTFETRPA